MVTQVKIISLVDKMGKSDTRKNPLPFSCALGDGENYFIPCQTILSGDNIFITCQRELLDVGKNLMINRRMANPQLIY